jgi:hypothetical protein
MAIDELDEISLYPEDQELVLGAVLFPAAEPGTSPPNEFGIQFVGQEPYAKESLRDLFALVKSTVDAPSDTTAFYMPTLAQESAAEEHADYFERHGIQLASPERWVSGNSCYSQGWALGRLKFIPADEIDAAFADGRLQSSDVLLTDGIPAELPPVAGIISLAPATPNSDVAIKAQEDQVPFVYMSKSADQQRAQKLADDEIFFLVISHKIRVLQQWDMLVIQDEIRLLDFFGGKRLQLFIRLFLTHEFR